ncbi:MAG: SusD/RagB family nutrient-binding outer membrane lipoprotein [Muricauda sp.]|nr:SusD/RagB family nutrient-binding outer membrane lipoprotein [Allomuricauda sp.]
MIFAFTLAAGITFNSCETLELEQVDNPNQLTEADPDLLLNSIQLSYRNAVTTFNNVGSQLSRIEYMSGRNYFNTWGSGTLDGAWTNLYANIVPDIAAIQEIDAASEDVDLSFHVGVSKIMEAHLLMLFVDYIGDIPYSQINQPDEFPNPTVDNDEEVYASARALLAEAKSLLNGASIGTGTDFYYDGDADAWIKLANTLLMRADLTVGNYSAVINATNVIEDSADDFEFAYGTNANSPDTRHPDYASDYRSDGANLYRSNWLINLMAGSYGDYFEDDDPRRRYYFYRQNAITPGNITVLYNQDTDSYSIISGAPNGETLSCSLETVPSQLEFTPDEDYWCSAKLGYWGRMHGDDDGIPPDNFTRTAVGVYPAGGNFDDHDDFITTYYDAEEDDDVFVTYTNRLALGAGGGGAGIEPIMLSSYVEFMRAEAYMAQSNPTAAAAALEDGITESITKVVAFGSLDGGADSSYAPDETRIQTFIDDMVAEFESASTTTGLDGFGWPVDKDKMDILGEQYFVALYGAGADAFNFIRRTGYPRTLARNVEINPGPFPRTLLYPSGEVSSNPNLNQRTDNATQVFWDNGVTNPAN